MTRALSRSEDPLVRSSGVLEYVPTQLSEHGCELTKSNRDTVPLYANFAGSTRLLLLKIRRASVMCR